MDIHKAIGYLKGELRDLNGFIDAVEANVAARHKRRVKQATRRPQTYGGAVATDSGKTDSTDALLRVRIPPTESP
jgi:hypothetical protein